MTIEQAMAEASFEHQVAEQDEPVMGYTHPPCPADITVELERLRAFRSAVIGWRESDQPEGFCRRTAEIVVLLGKTAAKEELK